MKTTYYHAKENYTYYERLLEQHDDGPLYVIYFFKRNTVCTIEFGSYRFKNDCYHEKISKEKMEEILFLHSL